MKEGKYDPPVTITTVAGMEPARKFKTGESVEDNVMTRWAEKRLGIKIKYLWSVVIANDSYNTRLRLMISSNEPMPDVLYVTDTQLMNEMIDSGQFRDSVWYLATRQGKRYGIPQFRFLNDSATVMWVREDWREKLHLPELKTIADVENMKDAIKKNPDGLKDIIPLATGLQSSLIDEIGGLDPIFGAFGTMPERWLWDGKTLKYGSVQLAMKACFEQIVGMDEERLSPFRSRLLEFRTSY